jgi:hypothetical protein
MPIWDDGGKYIQDKEKRETTDKVIEVKPLQLKILFYYFKVIQGLIIKSLSVQREKLRR